MKTHKHLYPLITDFENLRLAFKRAARGKRSHPDVAAFARSQPASTRAFPGLAQWHLLSYSRPASTLVSSSCIRVRSQPASTRAFFTGDS